MEQNDFLAMFLEESHEHLQALNDNVLILESNPEDISVVGEIFRSAHTFKGMAATMGFTDLSNLTHEMENVLDSVRNNKMDVTSDVIDIVFECIDNLERMVSDIQNGGKGNLDVSGTVAKLKNLHSNNGKLNVAPVPSLTKEDINEFKNISSTHHIIVKIKEDCLLKSVRAIMVLDSLSNHHGDVIETVPSMEKIEKEDFDSIIEIGLFSNSTNKEIENTILGISEIESVVIISADSGTDVGVEEFKNPNSTHHITVKLREDCILRSVRAIMVLDALGNNHGEVLETIPSMELIEKDEFEYSFKIGLSSNSSNKDIENTLLGISEIESVIVTNPEVVAPSSVKKEEKQIVNTPSKTTKKEPENGKKINNQTIRVNLEKIEALMNMFEETVIERGRIEEIAASLGSHELTERLQRLANVSKDLQNIVLNMRMVPVDIVFNRFPRMVRSLAKDLGKKINLIIEGEDTEIDRIVIDEIGDSLVHLVRNSVDHGIETQEKRAEKGKNATGTVRLEAFHSGNNVVIQISDDGNGINRQAVTAKAVKSGIISDGDAQRLSDAEVYDLLFQPGFSTAEKISDISGRGVGLDVVKTTILKLGGKLSVKSEEGIGSTFTIELPLTLSIIQSMLVETKGVRYAIPLGNIVESMRLTPSEVHPIQGKTVINYRDKTIQILSLGDIFHNTDTLSEENTNWLQVIIIKSNDRTFALSVDKILGQREIVLKSLGTFFKDSADYFSGATILGDGKVVLIVDIEKLRK